MIGTIGDIRRIYMEIDELLTDIDTEKVEGIHEEITKAAVQIKLSQCYSELMTCKELIIKEFGE